MAVILISIALLGVMLLVISKDSEVFREDQEAAAKLKERSK